MSDNPTVLSLHRYPVKSMLGQQVEVLDLDRRGCVGDRVWSVRTEAGKIASGKNTHRFAAVTGLLQLRAEGHGAEVRITFPDGTLCAVDDAAAAERLSAHVGEPVSLASESAVSHFDDGPVSLLGSASLAALARHRGERVDAARFRSNIVVETMTPFVEQTWVGARVSVGAAVLEVTMASPRCVMVDACTAELPAQRGNLKAIGELNEACLGVVAEVVTLGRVSAGDAVVVHG